MAAARKPKAPVTNEIAVTGGAADITQPYVSALGLLQPEDPLLQARGGNLALYEEVARDPRVKSCFQQRQLAVVSREWKVDAGGDAAIDKQAAEHLEAQLRAIGFDRCTLKLSFGIFYGFGVAEIMWAIGDDGLVKIDRIKVKKSRRFGFGVQGDLRLKTMTRPEGEPVPERKFWTYTAGAEHDDDPYGRGLGYWLYWPVWFKRNGVRFWARFLEKFGAPTAKGTYPRNASPEDQKKLLQSLRALQESAGIALPEGMDAMLLESAKSASDHKDFVAIMNSEITQIILSQTMTTEDGSSHSQSETHFDVRQEVAKSDADLMCESFNEGPARWLTEWNFPGAAMPRVYRDFEEPEDLDKVAERDAQVQAMGYEADESYIQETYGKHWRKKAPEPQPAGLIAAPGMRQLPFGQAGQLALPKPQPDDAAFAETHVATDAIDAGAAAMLSQWEMMVAPLAAQIEAEAAQASSYEDLASRLLAMVPLMDVAAFNEAMARASFQARLGGLAGDALSDAEEGP